MIGDVFARNPYPAPVWAKDMVIYEVNPRTFTSPQGVATGDGSGTFASMAKRLPYLQELGVNTIWLAGYCQATDHFYGVWSVYATNRPDVLDADLGDEVAFKALLDEAHAHGIRNPARCHIPWCARRQLPGKRAPRMVLQPVLGNDGLQL